MCFCSSQFLYPVFCPRLLFLLLLFQLLLCIIIFMFLTLSIQFPTPDKVRNFHATEVSTVTSAETRWVRTLQDHTWANVQLEMIALDAKVVVLILL
jgi:hypothetical protein